MYVATSPSMAQWKSTEHQQTISSSLTVKTIE